MFDRVNELSPIPLLSIVEETCNYMKKTEIILGCTELPLILTESELGIPFFNTTKIHVDSIINYYLNKC